MSDLPEQPTAEEIEQFPQAPELPDPVDTNTDHKDVEAHTVAKVSGADVDPDGEGTVEVA